MKGSAIALFIVVLCTLITVEAPAQTFGHGSDTNNPTFEASLFNVAVLSHGRICQVGGVRRRK